jgi:hypothetical protein
MSNFDRFGIDHNVSPLISRGFTVRPCSARVNGRRRGLAVLGDCHGRERRPSCPARLQEKQKLQGRKKRRYTSARGNSAIAVRNILVLFHEIDSATKTLDIAAFPGYGVSGGWKMGWHSGCFRRLSASLKWLNRVPTALNRHPARKGRARLSFRRSRKPKKGSWTWKSCVDRTSPARG